MAFFEARLPDRFSFGAKGGPVFSTTVRYTGSGQRYANRNVLLPLHEYDITNAIRTEADFQQLRAFFYVVAGAYDGFRFRALEDCKASLVEGNLAPITPGVFQLQKAYSFLNRTFQRPILKPVAGSVTVYRTRATAQSVIIALIDYTTGRVTVSGDQPGDTYQWMGEFDVPVAFVLDKMDAEVVDRSGQAGLLMGWPNVSVKEFR